MHISAAPTNIFSCLPCLPIHDQPASPVDESGYYYLEALSQEPLAVWVEIRPCDSEGLASAYMAPAAHTPVRKELRC